MLGFLNLVQCSKSVLIKAAVRILNVTDLWLSDLRMDLLRVLYRVQPGCKRERQLTINSLVRAGESICELPLVRADLTH